MQERVLFDFNSISDYIKFVKNYCSNMQGRQVIIEKSFINLGQFWNDKVYSETGNTLYLTAGYLRKIYDGLRNSLYSVIDIYNGLCDYNKSSLHIARVHIDDYASTLRGETTMGKNIISTNPDALKDFVHKLQNYINETDNAIREIKRRHSDMAQYWQGKQYNQFGQVIDDTSKSINLQLSNLKEQSKYIDRKYYELLFVLSKNANKLN